VSAGSPKVVRDLTIFAPPIQQQASLAENYVKICLFRFPDFWHQKMTHLSHIGNDLKHYLNKTPKPVTKLQHLPLTQTLWKQEELHLTNFQNGTLQLNWPGWTSLTLHIMGLWLLNAVSTRVMLQFLSPQSALCHFAFPPRHFWPGQMGFGVFTMIRMWGSIWPGQHF
jgi:hypothetical protein